MVALFQKQIISVMWLDLLLIREETTMSGLASCHQHGQQQKACVLTDICVNTCVIWIERDKPQCDSEPLFVVIDSTFYGCPTMANDLEMCGMTHPT